MSHFSVWVFTESGTETEIDDLLSPYYEGVEVEPYIDRRREDIVPEYRTRWNEYLARAEQDLLKAAPEDRPSVLGRISKIRTALARSDEEIYRAKRTARNWTRRETFSLPTIRIPSGIGTR